MPKTKSKSGTRRYHHGDLRRALITAAWAVVRDKGVEALTLREIAREVGVSHAAPYHHFDSREALLGVLADEAFEELATAMGTAAAGCSDALERLFLVGRAYVDHARAHPEHLQVMFRSRTDALGNEGPESPRTRAFEHLLEAVRACQSEGVAPSGDPHDLSLSAWSLVHGFATLWNDGPLAQSPHYAGRFEALRDATLRGFGASWSAVAREEHVCEAEARC